MLCAAAMMCTAGRMLQEKLDVFQLTFYTAPVSLAVLFPFFITREASLSLPDGHVKRSALRAQHEDMPAA